MSVQRSDAQKKGHSSEQDRSLGCRRFRACWQKQSSQQSRKWMTFFFCSCVMLEGAAVFSAS